MKNWIAQIVFAGSLIACAAGSSLNAAPSASKVAAVASVDKKQRSAPLDAKQVEVWLDGYVPTVLKQSGVPGAVVVIVRDGRVLLQKGYGMADVQRGIGVGPENTIFRVGSISKLFTWTAVMQLVEDGRIDLDADINDYLDFQIPPFRGQPMTMRNIMTHTSGFEETLKGMIVRDPASINLEHTVKTTLPNRIFLPGTTPAYSNYASILAGYVVQRVSGERYEDYVSRHILRPLNMWHSTFDQPLAPSLASMVATGYDENLRAGEFELIPQTPAGALSASGADIGKFMIAHLSQGDGGHSLLAPATRGVMQHTNLALMSSLKGIGLGFLIMDRNGRRIIGHAGDTFYFHSLLALLPEERMGIFIAVNGNPKGSVDPHIETIKAFVDRYFPGQPTYPETKGLDAQAGAITAVGRYYSARGAFSNFLAVLNILGQVSIYTNDDGTISTDIATDAAGAPLRFRLIAPNLWREVNGQELLGITVRDGKAVRMTTSTLAGINVFERASPSQSATWLIPVMAASMILLLVTAISWPIRAIIRRRFGESFPYSGKRAIAFRCVNVFSIAMLCLLVGWAYLIGMIMDGVDGIYTISNMDGRLLALQIFTIVGAIGGWCAAIANLQISWSTAHNWASKFWSLLLVAAFTIIVWFCWVAGFLVVTTRF